MAKLRRLHSTTPGLLSACLLVSSRANRPPSSQDLRLNHCALDRKICSARLPTRPNCATRYAQPNASLHSASSFRHDAPILARPMQRNRSPSSRIPRLSARQRCSRRDMLAYILRRLDRPLSYSPSIYAVTVSYLYNHGAGIVARQAMLTAVGEIVPFP